MAEETAPRPESSSSTPGRSADNATLRCARLHLRIGWWSVLVFLSLGIGLAGAYLFQVDSYFAAAGETTRLMWTLAHVHGTLLGLVQIAFGATVYLATGWNPRPRKVASRCLLLAGLLLPIGFFLGGVFATGGDPSLGIALVPAGALALFVSILLTARGATAVPVLFEERFTDDSQPP